MEKNFIKPAAITATMLALQFQTISSPISIDNFQNSKAYTYPNVNRYIIPVTFNSQLDIINKVNDLKNLPDNWDGYNAVSPDIKVIFNSLKFIKFLPDVLIDELNISNITPTPYGTIVFDWKSGEDEISVEIGETDIGFFSEINGDSSLFVPSVKFSESNIPTELYLAFKKFPLSVNA